MGSSMKVTSRPQASQTIRFWHVRFHNGGTNESPTNHQGWVVAVRDDEILNPSRRPGRRPLMEEEVLVQRSYQEALARVLRLELDNGPDGEWSAYPDLTCDIIEWMAEGVAELYC